VARFIPALTRKKEADARVGLRMAKGQPKHSADQ
jgi:hypothetical protein